MLLYSLFTIILMCLFLLVIECRPDWSDFSGMMITLSLIGMMLMGILVGIGRELVKDGGGQAIAETIKGYPIVSLRVKNYQNGDFFIGSGTFKDADMYVVYEKIDEMTFRQVKIPCEDALLIQSDKEKPRVEWTLRTAKSPLFLRITPGHTYTFKKGAYRIHIPENTIIERFNVE